MKQMKWEITFENDFWKAEGKSFFPNEWAKNKVKQFIKTQRKELLDSIKEGIGKIEKVNDSNGRFNACQEILKIIKSKI